jgi:hypothetical protein
MNRSLLVPGDRKGKRPVNGKQPHHALTAVEIAIVIAVLLIIGLVSAVWFRGYLVRRTIAETYRDLLWLSIATEAYYVDWSSYPLPLMELKAPLSYSATSSTGWLAYDGSRKLPGGRAHDLEADFQRYFQKYWPRLLTTPMPYLTKVPRDRFSQQGDGYRYSGQFRYGGYERYILLACGPDGDRDLPLHDFLAEPVRKDDLASPTSSRYGLPRPLITYRYDPTNGLVSDGDIFYFSGVDSHLYAPWRSAKMPRKISKN